jgi:hypothetical protein
MKKPTTVKNPDGSRSILRTKKDRISFFLEILRWNYGVKFHLALFKDDEIVLESESAAKDCMVLIETKHLIRSRDKITLEQVGKKILIHTPDEVQELKFYDVMDTEPDYVERRMRELNPSSK